MAQFEYKTLLLGPSATGDLGVSTDDGESAHHEALHVHLNALVAQGWEVDQVIPGIPTAGSYSILNYPTLLLRRLVPAE